MPDPLKILEEYQSLKSERVASWDSRWQKVLEWIAPFRADITEVNTPTPNTSYRSRLHDTKAIEAADVLISAHMSYITPLNEDWLSYAAPRNLRDNDEVVSYFKKCSEIAMEEIARSNFYSVMQSVYEDRSIPGTACLLLKKGEENELNFRYVPLGTYCFAENDDGLANVMFREFELTLTQAVDEFGEDKLGEKLRGFWGQVSAKPALANQRHKFLQCTRPRKNRKLGAEDQLNKPFADVYVCMTDKHVLREGGFDEFPFMVSRYKKWGNHLWGCSPAYSALPNVTAANYIRQILKTLGEVAAQPRILELAGSKRQIDLRAGGRTKVTLQEAQLGFPRELGSQGRYDIGMALLELDHESIEQFFHVPLFRMFASIEKQMTATEIAAREREKLLMFAPSFTQFVTDMTPIMLRIFAMLVRAGKFPDPPQALIQQTSAGEAVIPNPQVVYQSRIALAIKALHGEGFDRVMGRALQFAEFRPELFDNWNLDQIFRDLSRNEGMPEAWLMLEKLRDEMRQSRAEAQAEQAAAMQAEQAAGAVGKVGGAEGIKQLGDMMQ
jgi:hypothetical protein